MNLPLLRPILRRLPSRNSRRRSGKTSATYPGESAWVKFVAGILSIGGGSSLGREGPSVQLAGAVASNLAGVLGEPKQNRRLAAAAGAAAGLAAAFNTPLAAVTFVLEEIVQDLNSRILGSVLLASLWGALVVHGVIGKQPAFTLGAVESSGWLVYLLVPMVAGARGFLRAWRHSWRSPATAAGIARGTDRRACGTDRGPVGRRHPARSVARGTGSGR